MIGPSVKANFLTRPSSAKNAANRSQWLVPNAVEVYRLTANFLSNVSTLYPPQPPLPQMGRRQLGLSALMVIFLSLFSPSEATAQDPQRDWSLTLYLGRLTDSDLTHTATFNSKFENAYFIDLGLSRRLYTFRDYFNIEIEGQIAKHFGAQDQWEFNLIGYFRWLLFPWDAYLDTSFAAGVGLSYATSVPQIEAQNYDKTAQFLGALMFEFAFPFPKFHGGAWSQAFIIARVQVDFSAAFGAPPTRG
jgi:hypothetical protein